MNCHQSRVDADSIALPSGSQWCSCVRMAVLQTVPEITQQQKTMGMSKHNYNNFDCLVMGNLSPGGCIWLWFRKGFNGGQQYRSVAWDVIFL